MASVRGKERGPVCYSFSAVAQNIVCAEADENEKNADFNNHNQRCKSDRLLDADDENRGDEQDSQKAEQIKRRILMGQADGINVRSRQRLLQLRSQPFPVALI